MRYLEKRFSVPAAPASVTQEEWDSIFGKKADLPAPGGSRLPLVEMVKEIIEEARTEVFGEGANNE